ncbi:ABC transporter ATP-binding protein [Euzebya sp.]|uniref:ABC transporter ATP-binding protein n=1 Tax=Euzebya sp. TaxID=1971409 RepID=UPI003514EA5D
MAVQQLTGTGATPAQADGDGLVVQGLAVDYAGSVVALDGVSISVPPGGFVSVLGANGAGKTTLVRTITNLLFVHDGHIRQGTITLDGEPVHGIGARRLVRAGVCQVPEGRMLFPRLTVEENLRVGAASRSSAKEIDADVDRMWELFPNLVKRRGDRAGYLSGGEQQMIAVGRALMARPRLLICDELSLGLAPMIVRDLFDLLTRLNAEEGVGVLVIEQNARMALSHSHYGYVLETGRVVVEGTSAELQSDGYVQEYYLGGAGEAKEAYEAVVARYARRSA